MTQKQLINANNAELNNVKAEVAKLPMADDVKNGRYVWGKYDAKGGTLLSYTVSDSETAYPDGGEKDGFWYERAREGIPLPPGYTKFAVDKVVYPSDKSGTVTMPHSLGVIPRIALLTVENDNIPSPSTSTYYIYKRLSGTEPQTVPTDAYGSGVYFYTYKGGNGNDDTVGEMFMPSEIIFKATNSYATYKAGVEYTLITMA